MDEFPSEEELRKRALKRIEERQEEVQGFYWHLVIFLGVNLLVFGWGNWFVQLLNGSATGLPGGAWITFFWGMGMLGHFWEYWTKHGPGRERNERLIEREIERERERLYDMGMTEKRKNDFMLTDDGELVEIPTDEERRRRL